MLVVKHKLCMFTKIHINGVFMYGEKLKQIRKALNVTQDKMAELLNISARTYSAYERNENKPSYIMLVDLCQNKNINLNWFIADVGEMFNSKQTSVINKELEQKVVEIMKKYGIIEK